MRSLLRVVDPGRVHVDGWGNVHPCQGVLLDNLTKTPLHERFPEFLGPPKEYGVEYRG